MDRRTARGNRWGLILLGLPLVAVGGYALARALGAYGAARAREPVLTPAVSGYVAANPWPGWLAAAVAVVLALLGLRWLLAQSRRETRAGLRLDDSPAGRTEIESSGIISAFEDDLTRHPAIVDAHADVTGTGAHPGVRVRMAVDDTTPLDTVLDHLGHRAIPRMREALEVEHLPAEVRLQTVPAASRGRTLR